MLGHRSVRQSYVHWLSEPNASRRSRYPTPAEILRHGEIRRRPEAVAPDGAFRYGMTLPTVLALLLVVGFPLAFALYVSTHEYDLTEGGIGAFTGSRTTRDHPR